MDKVKAKRCVNVPRSGPARRRQHRRGCEPQPPAPCRLPTAAASTGSAAQTETESGDAPSTPPIVIRELITNDQILSISDSETNHLILSLSLSLSPSLPPSSLPLNGYAVG